MLAKALAVVCHGANAILFYRIFNQMKLTSEISVWLASLYALSPFYYGRGLLLLAGVDLFLLCYLVSIWLLCCQRRAAHITALFFFVLSIGHETFLFMEPLRALFVHEARKDLRRTIRTCLPFWIIGATFVILRAILLKPYGHYAQYNQLFNADMFYMFRVLVSTVLFYFRALWFDINCALNLVEWYGMVAAFLVCLVLAWLWSHKIESRIPVAQAGWALTFRRLGFGLLLAFLGAVPYILIGRSPHPHYLSSRFAVVSIPGALIVLVSLIALLPGRLLRTYLLLMVLAVSGLASLQVTKWYFYESLVKRDLIMQLYDVTSNFREKPMRIVVELVPKTSDVLLLRRTFSSYDLNVPLNVLRDPAWPLVFVQDLWWYQEVSPDKPLDQHCVIAWEPCPCPGPPVRVRYTLHPDKSSVTKMRFVELLRSSFETFRFPPGMGVLTEEDDPGPLRRPIEPRLSQEGHQMRPGGESALCILGVSPQFLGR